MIMRDSGKGMIARKSALIIFINLVNGLLGYLAIFLVARFMDTPDYALGVVSFAYGFVSLFHIFLYFALI